MTQKDYALRRACIESNNKFIKEFELFQKSDIEYSKKYKKEINRINREIIGSDKSIYPEVDNKE